MLHASDTVGALAEALAKAQATMRHAVKDATGQVGQQKTRYADLAGVIDAARDHLAANGLAYVQGVSMDSDGFVAVTTRLMHSSGEWLEDSLALPAAQKTAQGYGSAITYARRYALQAMLGLAADDDDGAAASFVPQRAERRPVSPARRAPEPSDDVPPPTDPDDPLIRRSRALVALYTSASALQHAVEGACEANGWTVPKVAEGERLSMVLAGPHCSEIYDVLVAP